jgi:hypothetical protein
VVVVVLVGYPLSWGLAMRLEFRDEMPDSISPLADQFYRPMLWVWRTSPKPIKTAIDWYLDLCVMSGD